MTHQEVREAIAEFADALQSRGVATKHLIRGCTQAEIEEIESDVGRTLPLAYREFLVRMGREAGAFFVGTDMFYPNILGNTDAAHGLVSEDKSGLELPRDAIAFSMHQGYQFLFVRAEEGDDPPVYYYMEQTGQFVKKADRFTQFLKDVVNDEW